jgi:transcription initiation factor TFIID subunit 7
MEEHFILRVPQSVAERLERILNENPESAGDELLDLAFHGQPFSTDFIVVCCSRRRRIRLHA